MADYALQTVGLGATANDDTGDDLRAGADKINDNFAQLFASFTMDSTTNYVGIGTSAPQQKIDLGPSPGGAGITWGTSATAQFLNIWGAYSSGDLYIAAGLKGNTAADDVRYSATASIAAAYMRFDAVNGDIIWGAEASASRTYEAASTTPERMRLDRYGNFLIGGAARGSSSEGNLHLFNGTVPTAGPADGVVLYSEDVSASAELKVMDEANNITTLSPHNFSLCGGPSEEMAWAYFSERGGKKINVDMLRVARLLEELTGEKLVFIE